MSAQTAAAAIAALVSLAAHRGGRASRADPAAAVRAPMLAWLIGFALFSVAELALWYGAANGWTSAAFRIYYLAGGILVVAVSGGRRAAAGRCPAAGSRGWRWPPCCG